MKVLKLSIIYFIEVIEYLRNLFLKFISIIFWPKKINPKKIKKIMIYRVGNIGDLIVSIPSIELIKSKFPDAKLILLSSPGYIGSVGANAVFKNLDIFDEVHEYYLGKGEGLFNFIKSNNSFKDIDLIVDLPSQFETVRSILKRMLFHKFINPNYAFGWEISTTKVFRKIQNSIRKFPYEKDRLISIIKKNTKNIVSKPIDNFSLKLNYESNPASVLSNKYVVIAPGAKRSTNRWSIENFYDLIEYLDSRSIECVLVGGSDVIELSDSLEKRFKNITNFCGRIDLFQSMQVISSASLSICLDSGIQHISHVLQIPTVSIFSSRDFSGKWFPNNPTDYIFRSSVDCDVCLLEKCPFENKCVNQIKPIDIINYLDQAI